MNNIRFTKASWRERIKLAIYHVLVVAEAIVFFASLSLLHLDVAANWVFSDYLEDD